MIGNCYQIGNLCCTFSSTLELVIENNGDKQAVTMVKIKYTSEDGEFPDID